jgi:lantibiotic biosynthesis protein
METLLQQIETNHAIIKSHKATNDSLLGGGLGLSLYYYTRYKVLRNNKDADMAIDIIADILQRFNNSKDPNLKHSFGSGAAGLGYLLNLYRKDGLIDTGIKKEFAPMDEYIFKAALSQIEVSDNHDYLHGAMGAVHYFLSRLPNKLIQPYITTLLSAFCHKVVTTPHGTWFKNIASIHDKETEINLSLAHGQASFLLLLIQAAKAGITIPQSSHTIENLVTSGLQLIEHVQMQIDFEKGNYSFFPASVDSTTMQPVFAKARISWCYGDLNILLVLYQAVTLLPSVWGTKQRLRQNQIIGILSNFRKDAIASGIIDTHFCHGSSGLVQFYKHLYRLTKLPVYQEASEFWLSKTLRLLPTDIEKGIYIGKETDLLEGLVGVNLVLLDSIAKKELEWTKLFLL